MLCRTLHRCRLAVVILAVVLVVLAVTSRERRHHGVHARHWDQALVRSRHTHTRTHVSETTTAQAVQQQLLTGTESQVRLQDHLPIITLLRYH